MRRHGHRGSIRVSATLVLLGLATAVLVVRAAVLYGAWSARGQAAKPAVPELPFLPAARLRGQRDGRWEAMHRRFVLRARSPPSPAVLFVGDSIARGLYVSAAWRVIAAAAAEIGGGAEAFAVGGDRTQHILWRLRGGELEFPKRPPALAVVIAGTNNLNDDDPSDVASGVLQVGRRLSEAGIPRVLVAELLPRGPDAGNELRTAQRQVNSNLTKALRLLQVGRGRCMRFAGGLSQLFLSSDGSIDVQLMDDYVHPTPAGYERLADALLPHVRAEC
eukprot:TRINITY_DN11222_c0_g1_i1.p1 TRINITY_DN11222_c0_g1~~TRINITY_DN11222_c0_g1_i1.p1  ORF type:complete len:276 (+),score=104.55 TRINITY_DN11222_c0_g1_i1:69-896(+)